MRDTVLETDRKHPHLHLMAAEAAAKVYLKGRRASSDLPKYLRAALKGEEMEAKYLDDRNVKEIAGEVVDAFRRYGYAKEQEIAAFCELYKQEAEQIAYVSGRAWEFGEKLPPTSDWRELINMCNRIYSVM